MILGRYRKHIVIFLTLAVLGTGFYVFFQTSSEPPATETEEIQIPTQTENAGWKTYTNTKYGYEIQYPEEWEAWYMLPRDETIYPAQGDVESGPRLGPPYRNGRRSLGGEVHIGVSETLVETYKELAQSLQRDYCAKNGKEIDVGGERGSMYECAAYGGHQYTEVGVIYENFVYTFTAAHENDKGPPSKIFPEILKTFKFIE